MYKTEIKFYNGEENIKEDTPCEMIPQRESEVYTDLDFTEVQLFAI